MSAAELPRSLRLPWLLAAALALVLASSLVVWWLIGREHAQQQWVTHTEAVLRHLDALLADVVDSETAERGFVISGEATFLAPYEAARRRLDHDLAALAQLTQDNPAQRARLAHAERVARAELAAFGRVIALRDSDREAAMAAIAGAGDKLFTDEVRDVLSAMKREELGLLSRRQQAAAYATQRAALATFAVQGLVLGVLVAGASLLQRSATRRRSAEQRAAALEAQMELARTRRERDDFREQFLAIVGHDLRTPLGAIAIEAQLLDELDERSERTATGQRILASVRRMTRMVEQLVDATRTRLGGGMPIRKEDTDLSAVVAHAVSELARTQPARVLLTLPPEPAHGPFDGDRMAQVVSNLVGNALAHGIGEVTVTLREVDAQLELRVHNFGPVIAPDALAHVLEPFHRGSGDSAGLGLGLYISDQIVRGHGGTLTITSRADEGTRVTARLPRA